MHRGTRTFTDHKLVKTSMKFEWTKLSKPKVEILKTAISNFGYKNKQIELINSPSHQTKHHHKITGTTLFCLVSL